MSKISREFFEKHKPKVLTIFNLENRKFILDAIDNTSNFIITDLFWKGSEMLMFSNSKKRKRIEMKFITCLVEVVDCKIKSFFELFKGDIRVFFLNGKRSNLIYKKRIFSDDELLEIDPLLGSEQSYNVYECDQYSKPTGDFFIEVDAKTWLQAITKVKNNRYTSKYYNADEVYG